MPMAPGQEPVDQERTLDQLFADGSIEAAALEALLSEIARLQADIRYVHPHARLEQKALLTEHQVHRYDRLRGYGRSHEGTQHDHAH